MMIRGRAPTRIDFAGGTTDLPAFREREGGAVISAAVDRYAYCSLQPVPGDGVRIVAQDLGQFIEAASVRDLEFDGNMDLLKAAVRSLQVEGGFCVMARCDAPPGSGMGSSASVGVTLLGLLDRFRARNSGDRRHLMTRLEIADLATKLENEIGIIGGKQDQVASCLGGIVYAEFHGDTVVAERLEISPAVRLDLEKHLVLCYTGQSRLSGNTNQQMITAYEAGDSKVTQALRTVKRVAQDVRRALIGEELEWFAELLEEEWQARIHLAQGVVTGQMHELRATGLQAGASAAKVCGAGGGGCLLFYCKPDAEVDVVRGLEAAGGQILDFTFDFNGLELWETN